MTDHRLPWPEFFYDVCDWFYWSPRIFHRLPDPNLLVKGFGPVRERLTRTEEALNHILRMFFSLAPDRFISELTATTIREAWSDKYVVVGRDFEERYRLPSNSTQPDFVFDAPGHFVTMEMKVAAKTNPRQLAKYLYLHAMADVAGEKGRRHALIYLGPKTWPELWNDRRDLSFEQRLEEAVENAPRTVGIDKVRVDVAKLRAMAERIRLGYLSYEDLVGMFLDLRGTIAGEAWEAEVAKRLLDGMIDEIVRRGLAEVRSVKVTE